MEIFISAIWMEENKKDGRRDKTISRAYDLVGKRVNWRLFNVGDLSLISF